MEVINTEISILDIIKQLKHQNNMAIRNGKQLKIYFSGSSESEQTDFENASNYLIIGVIANDPLVGSTMLRILRYIIDEQFELFERDKENASHENEELLSYLSALESEFQSSFKIHDTPHIQLIGSNDKSNGGKNTICRSLNNIDIWTLKRMKMYMKHILSN